MNGPGPAHVHVKFPRQQDIVRQCLGTLAGNAHNEPRTDFIAGPPQALQRIHPLRERVSGMQGSVQGCIRRFMLQKEAGCAASFHSA